MDNLRYKEYLKTEKWKRIVEKRLKIDGYQCVMCGTRGTAENKLEVHHLSYKFLYHEEDRIYQDLCTLCHLHHKAVHALMNRITDPNGRHGWKDNSNIPQISVYTIAGDDMEFREV